jgi:broad specificity phosphatase PhoE
MAIVVWWLCWRPVTTLLIVRHAERLGSQDQLSEAGLTRAEELLHVAAEVSLAAIYTSDTNRARQTAKPLASALGLTPVVLPAEPATTLVTHIFVNHRGRTVLVVGHSNTVPQIISAAGGPTLANLPEDEFDRLFVLETCRCRWGRSKLINLQYGATSP